MRFPVRVHDAADWRRRFRLAAGVALVAAGVFGTVHSVRAALAQCLAAAPADRLVVGIGTGADEAQVDAAAFRDEVAAASAAHLRGVAFFALDDALLELLPGLPAADRP